MQRMKRQVVSMKRVSVSTYLSLRYRACDRTRGEENRNIVSEGRRNVRGKPFFFFSFLSWSSSFRVVTNRRVIRKAVKSNDSSFSTLHPSHERFRPLTKAFCQPPRIRRHVRETVPVRGRGSGRFFILPLVTWITRSLSLAQLSYSRYYRRETMKFRARIHGESRKRNISLLLTFSISQREISEKTIYIIFWELY